MREDASFRVPRSRVFETHKAMKDALLEAVENIIVGGIRKGEQCVLELEEQIRCLIRKKYVYGVHSGTVGLFLALRACGVRSGDEVITVANSDISTTAAISHCGAVPVFCDILKDDFTIDPEKVELAITDRTKAVLPVDIYGHPANVRDLREIANKHNLAIVEDAALAIGAFDFGRPVGSFADVVVFSFAPFKPLGCVGNAGAVATDDPEVARQLRLLRGYGADPEATCPGECQVFVGEGYNVTIDPLEAAVLKVKLPYLEKWTQARQAIAKHYENRLANTPVVTPRFRAGTEPTFRNYTVLVPHRDQIYTYLRNAGIEVTLHYSPPIYSHPVYRSAPFLVKGGLPITEDVCARLINLPVSPELDVRDIDFVIDTLLEAIQNSCRQMKSRQGRRRACCISSNGLESC